MQSTCGFSIAASDPRGHLLCGDREGGVDAGDDPVERLDQVVGVVERAVEADVDLRAGEQAEAALALVPRADLLDPLPEPLGGDVVAEAVAGRVVGDRHVGVAALAAGLGHLLERVATVGEGRVGVQVAADVVELDQVRQLAFARRLQLAAALAQLRLDVGVAEALVDLGLALAEVDLAALGVGDAVLGDREAAARPPLRAAARCGPWSR